MLIYTEDASGLTLDKVFSTYINNVTRILASSNNGTAKVVSIDKNVEIGAQKAYTVKCSSSGNYEMIAEFGFTIYKDKLYILAFVAREEDYQRYFNLIGQMIGTFKFTR